MKAWRSHPVAHGDDPSRPSVSRTWLGLVTVLVVVVALGATAAAYIAADQHVEATEKRVLEERALQGVTSFESFGQQIESIVAASGAIAEASDGDPGAFVRSMESRVASTILASVVLLRLDGNEVGQIAQVGRREAVLLPAIGTASLTRLREIAERGTLEITQLSTVDGGRVLGFASPARPGSEYVTYAELALPEVMLSTADRTPDVAFTVYAGAVEDPAKLIAGTPVSSERSSRSIHRIIKAGDEDMLAIYTPTQPLADGTTRALPWLAVGLGLVLTLVLGWIVELGRRRRLRALALVDLLEAKNEDLNHREKEYRELFENANDLVFASDLDGRIVSINGAGADLTGYPEDELRGMSFASLLAPDSQALARSMEERKLRGEVDATTYQVDLVSRAGVEIPVELSTRLIKRGGEPTGMQGIGRDIRVRRQLEARFRSLVQNSFDVIFVVGPTGLIAYQSPSALATLGYAPDELAHTSLLGIVHEPDQEAARAFLGVSRADADVARADIRVRRGDGSIAHVEMVANNLLDDPTVEGIVVTLHDVTERKELEEQLSYQAFHDPLTGLANRALFLDRVEHALEQRGRENSELAVLFLDLDDFKTVNDSLGHESGDQLLESVGERLRETLRAGDTCARLGGDEFAVLLESVPSREFVASMADRVLVALARPLELDSREVTVRVSIGVASSDEGELGGEDLLRNADAAMYTAKREGRGCVRFFESGMHTAALERLELKSDLEGALERGEFLLNYQPIVGIEQGSIELVEALLRWNHPTKGPMMPAEFVPLAEETGLIVPLGKWVLEEACRDAREWATQIPPGGTAPAISVNVAARQLQQSGFVGEVADVLAQSGTDPHQLVLEITESALVTNTRQIVRRLEDLRALGVRIAVDDFGTGYSSLSYLENFPVDVLKIAKPFIDSILEKDEESLAGAIVRLGGTLALHTVAEGVETPEQLEQLTALGCEMGQGFHFARPLSAARLAELLRNGLDEGAVARSDGDAGADVADAA